jgi:hypothetical protein
MTDLACKPLATHIAGRKDKGLVDLKFYVHKRSAATPAKVCAEAASIFDAIGAGAVERFEFNDRRTPHA